MATLSLSRDDPTTIFQLKQKLGQGAFGMVYRCTRIEDGFDVAVKMIPMTDYFAIKTEIDILSDCRHENIVQFCGIYQKDGYLWIAIEFMDGGSVTDIIESLETLSEDEISACCYSCIQGLAYLHRKRKVHRDIKAGNLLVDSRGLVKLADFGVSTGGKNMFEKKNDVIGSPYWMAPEVIQEQEYDGRADIWSLGITCIEMAEGNPPYFSSHPMRAVFMIPSKPSPKFKEPNNWSPEFNDFLAQCLVKDFKDRKTAADLLEHPFVVKGEAHSESIKALVSKYLAKKAEIKAEKLKEKLAKGESIEEEILQLPKPYVSEKNNDVSEKVEEAPKSNLPPSLSRKISGNNFSKSSQPQLPAKLSKTRSDNSIKKGRTVAPPSNSTQQKDWVNDLLGTMNEIETNISTKKTINKTVGVNTKSNSNKSSGLSQAAKTARTARGLLDSLNELNEEIENARAEGEGDQQIRGITIYSKIRNSDNIIGEIVVTSETTINELREMIVNELGFEDEINLVRNGETISAELFGESVNSVLEFDDFVVIA
eukprot:c20486_g2_i1.p1 GENE.c20486_g2_i1~~c20486_g2_i1.p1  ORF type:complete len:538 (+),score=254.93 c20486_g2_i1:1-1614(+)